MSQVAVFISGDSAIVKKGHIFIDVRGVRSNHWECSGITKIDGKWHSELLDYKELILIPQDSWLSDALKALV